ncbi:MAG: ABC transporter ATP-binding protein [Gemmatimonadetes bacterium GWC2_71_9]|nr:MAG: ABC transporter ATP-binding protein [Gemmatimonadetes bacterium GWC2_71_9]OGT97024.1 MAG: ABC transporter ATP-binding protein [Gemmatimonadetes bacterium RIFCSPLOWO2_02_FULL_71_11]
MTAATQPNVPRRPRSPFAPGEKVSWGERLEALKNVPPLLRMVWETHRGFATAIVALRVTRALVPVAVLWVGKLIIDGVVAAIQAHAAGRPVAWNYLAGLVVLELAVAITGEALARGHTLLESLLGDLFSNRVSVRLMEHAGTLDLRQFEDPAFYDHLERARRQTVGRIALIELILGTAQNLVTIVSLAGALLLYVPWLLGLLILAILPSFVGETHFAALGYSLLFRWTPERRQLDYLRYTAASDETAKEIKLFGLSRWLTDRYAALAAAFYRDNSRLSIRRSVVSTLLVTIGTLGYYGAYGWIIYLTITGYRSPAGPFTLGVLTFLAASFRQSRDLIQGTLLATSRIYEESLYLRDLFTFFAMRPTIASRDGSRPVPRPIGQGFEFKGVGFRYPGSETWAVRRLSFRLEPGERLALVGENGAGKTTLVKLLARLYDPDEGVILLDGVDLREYDVASLHATIGVIFQDFVRYELRLRENIGVGEIARVDDRPRIEDAADRSLAKGVAQRLPGKYEQMLGRRFEGGVELSGGEWQKVALARAYLREAEVLILDEPTAALDARAEYQVFLRFAELTKGKMAVLISHRFSTVRMADRILVLEQGEITEDGTHEALLARGGTYAELFTLQAAGYR